MDFSFCHLLDGIHLGLTMTFPFHLAEENFPKATVPKHMVDGETVKAGLFLSSASVLGLKVGNRSTAIFRV